MPGAVRKRKTGREQGAEKASAEKPGCKASRPSLLSAWQQVKPPTWVILSSLSVKWAETNSWEQAPERREYNFR